MASAAAGPRSGTLGEGLWRIWQHPETWGETKQVTGKEGPIELYIESPFFLPNVCASVIKRRGEECKIFIDNVPLSECIRKEVSYQRQENGLLKVKTEVKKIEYYTPRGKEEARSLYSFHTHDPYPFTVILSNGKDPTKSREFTIPPKLFEEAMRAAMAAQEILSDGRMLDYEFRGYGIKLRLTEELIDRKAKALEVPEELFSVQIRRDYIELNNSIAIEGAFDPRAAETNPRVEEFFKGISCQLNASQFKVFRDLLFEATQIVFGPNAPLEFMVYDETKSLEGYEIQIEATKGEFYNQRKIKLYKHPTDVSCYTAGSTEDFQPRTDLDTHLKITLFPPNAPDRPVVYGIRREVLRKIILRAFNNLPVKRGFEGRVYWTYSGTVLRSTCMINPSEATITFFINHSRAYSDKIFKVTDRVVAALPAPAAAAPAAQPPRPPPTEGE